MFANSLSMREQFVLDCESRNLDVRFAGGDAGTTKSK
jgi:hypothetical protein